MHMLSGVYKLNCADCHKFYIGQTGRNIKTRFNEHLYIKNENKLTSVGKHLKDSGHKTNINNMTVLHKAPKSKRLDLLEEMEIMRYRKIAPDLLLNEQTCYNNYYHLFAKFM